MRLFVFSVLLGCLYICKAQDIVAGALTVKTPAPATGKYVVYTETTITFDLAYTVTEAASPTAVKVYFSDAAGTKKTTPEVTATGANAPGGTEVTADGTYSDLVAKITLDAANCVDYTKLCVNIEISGTDQNLDDNKKCNDYGTNAAEAGTAVCADVAAAHSH
ncbi:uncharacterized protein [Ptychodera flava]|uniref:uncharacterized protein n=1 Tax=Ptychodera flava TaxID=63121 RepID=UPI003969CF4F